MHYLCKQKSFPSPTHRMDSLALIFSRPYLSNSRAVVMVVVRLSSVTDVLWLTGRA